MKKIILVLILISMLACGTRQNSKKDYTGIDKASFDKLYEEAKSKTPNLAIVYGFTLGVSEQEFDQILAEKVKNGEIEAVDMDNYPPIIKFDLLKNEKINMSVNCSASGVFKNFPVISFKTETIQDNTELIKTRNKLIDWAISKYGDQYHVSDMTDYSSTEPKKNFRWVTNTYSIDITDVMNRISLSYRMLE